MNYAAAAWVEEQCEAKYAAGRVLGVIAAHVGLDSADRTAWPSVKTIAKLAKVSPKTVRRALRTLPVSDGLIVAYNGGPSGPTGRPTSTPSPTNSVGQSSATL